MESSKIDFENLEIAFSSKPDRDLRRANFIFSLINSPTWSKMGIFVTKLSLGLGLPVSGIIRKTVFNHFCGGISISDCNSTVEHLKEFGVGTILDYSVEGEDSEEGFEQTKSEILRIIEAASKSEAVPFCVFKMTGIASSALLKKIQSGKELSDDEQSEFLRIQTRTDEICGASVAVNLPIMIDAEETWIQDPIDTLCIDMMRKYNKEKIMVYNTYQMYRVDSLERLMRDHRQLRSEGIKMGMKLVRGAYMEKERERAEEKGYPSPIHASKKDTDTSFDNGLRYCSENYSDVSVLCGSHNEHSNLLLTELMRDKNIAHNDPHFWFAQLFGMSDNISFNLGRAGYNVSKYVPYGPVRSVMPYLFRRAQENTSVEGQSSRELMMIRKEIRRRKSS